MGGSATRHTPLMPEAELRGRLAASHVAIVGCGGLGSNAAAMLVRCGVGELTLIDFDVVEESNLNRQLFFRDQLGRAKTEALAETLRRINPGVRLNTYRLEVTCENLGDLISGAGVVIEAVDTARTKALILGVCTRELPEIPLIVASGLAGYEPANLIVTERLADNVWVTGDLSADVSAGLPLLASRVMLAAAHEAHAAIRLLLEVGDP